MTSRHKRKEKGLNIRVIGLFEQSNEESYESDESQPSNTNTTTRGSVQTLSLLELLESDYTDEYADETQPLWIQVENATPKELQRIGEHFGLHPLTIEGIQTRHTREKLEIFQNYLFLVFHALHGGSVAQSGAFTSDIIARLPPGKGLGTFGAVNNALIDPFDLTRAQAAHLAGRESVDEDAPAGTPFLKESLSSPTPHEGSRLLSNTSKYYGGENSITLPRTSSTGHGGPSPLPPRRHKSQLQLSTRTPSPQPSPSRRKAPSGTATPRNDLPRPATHADRFRLPYPLGMGPDEISPDGSSSGTSGSSTASDTSMSEFEDTASVASVSPAVPVTTIAQYPTNVNVNVTEQSRLLIDTKSPTDSVESTDLAAKLPSIASDIPVPPAFSRTVEPLRTSPIKLIVFPHLVLSFHSSNLDTVNAVRHRLSRVYSNSVESTAWIIHALIDSITDSLLPVVNATATEVDALEELIYVLSGSEHRDLLKRMGMTRRRLSFLRQRLWSKRDILMSLIGKDWQLFLAGVQIPYLRDVYDHVVTMLHKVEAASDLLVALQNTYLANVQIDVAEASNDANTVMKNLTAVGSIILPMQLVAGLWGMNCTVPFQKDRHTTIESIAPFLSIVASMIIVLIVMTAYFRRSNLM